MTMPTARWPRLGRNNASHKVNARKNTTIFLGVTTTKPHARKSPNVYPANIYTENTYSEDSCSANFYSANIHF